MACRWVGILVGAAAVLGAFGCGSPSVNAIRLLGSQALDPPGRYLQRAVFDRGAFAASDGQGTAILLGPQAVLLFDYKGFGNRFELLIREHDQTILYRRVGQRPALFAEGRRITQPVGIRIDREDERLCGRFDVVLGRDDLHGFGPAFEHYPRHLRISGGFVLPRAFAVDPVATRAATSGPVRASTSRSAWPESLSDVSPIWLTEHLGKDLPPISKGGGVDLAPSPASLPQEGRKSFHGPARDGPFYPRL